MFVTTSISPYFQRSPGHLLLGSSFAHSSLITSEHNPGWATLLVVVSYFEIIYHENKYCAKINIADRNIRKLSNVSGLLTNNDQGYIFICLS